MNYKTFSNIFSFVLKSNVGKSLILGLITIAAAVPSAVAQHCTGIYSDMECYALYALYQSTGLLWDNDTNWCTPADVGSWYGVTVDPEGRVVSLDLRSNNLSNELPWELECLENLRSLNLESNNLTGSIPPELGNLAELRSLNLESNNLTGSIPPELGNLAELGSLYLYDNNLSGSIPPELGNLAELTLLDLAGNNLTGSIPPELGNLAELVYSASPTTT